MQYNASRMLTTSDFYRLNYAHQADALQKEGLFLQSRTEGNFVVDLYELQDLLVEIFYQKETEEPVSVMAYNTSEKIKSFGNLQPRLTVRNRPGFYRKGSYAA